MSDAETSMAAAIQEWMERHGITSGYDCPVLKVSLTGYSPDGTPLFHIRPAYDVELRDAVIHRSRN